MVTGNLTREVDRVRRGQVGLTPREADMVTVELISNDAAERAETRRVRARAPSSASQGRGHPLTASKAQSTRMPREPASTTRPARETASSTIYIYERVCDSVYVTSAQGHLLPATIRSFQKNGFRQVEAEPDRRFSNSANKFTVIDRVPDTDVHRRARQRHLTWATTHVRMRIGATGSGKGCCQTVIPKGPNTHLRQCIQPKKLKKSASRENLRQY
uniref:Uncharacterized protein n=1 Tax=Leersia perrieri TaxID=77586 RepID=A0A0D9W3W8_9ORYZ